MKSNLELVAAWVLERNTRRYLRETLEILERQPQLPCHILKDCLFGKFDCIIPALMRPGDWHLRFL